MMAMFVAGEAQEAEVEVGTVFACHKFMFGELCGGN